MRYWSLSPLLLLLFFLSIPNYSHAASADIAYFAIVGGQTRFERGEYLEVEFTVNYTKSAQVALYDQNGWYKEVAHWQFTTGTPPYSSAYKKRVQIPVSANIGLYTLALDAVGADGVHTVAFAGPADVVYASTPAVSNFSAGYSASNGSVQLAWDHIPYYDSYYVQRRIGNGSWSVISSPVKDRTYVDNNPPEGNISYSVLAFGKMLYYKDYTTSSISSSASVSIPATCSISISPTSKSISNSYGSSSFTVTAPQGCGWTATPTTDWIGIFESNRTGSGNGTVEFHWPLNPDSSPRKGAITIGDKQFIVEQAGALCSDNYRAWLEDGGYQPSTGGGGRIQVRAAGGCTWNASSQAEWITLGEAAGSGDGFVEYTLAANPETALRSGTVTVAGITLNISQRGAVAQCSSSLSANQLDFPYAAGHKTVTLTTSASTCSWAVDNNLSWVSVTPSSGTGSQTLQISVTHNNDDAARKGTIYIGGEALTIEQSAQLGSCSYSTWPRDGGWAFGPEGGSSLGIDINTSPGCTWTTSNNLSWASIVPSSGTGPAEAILYVEKNTNTASRSGTITIAGSTFSVSQRAAELPACTYSLSATSHSFAAGGGSVDVSVDTPSTQCTWSVSENETWLSVSGSSWSGDGTVRITAGANTSTSSRTGVVTIAGQSFTVNQAGASGSCSCSISPTSKSFTSAGGTVDVTIMTGSSCSWTAGDSMNWVSLSRTSGVGSGTLRITVSENKTYYDRSGTVSIGGKTFTITQSKTTACSFSISPTSKAFDSAGGSVTVSVSAGSSCTWSVSESLSWVSTARTNEAGSGSVRISVQPNTSTSSRSGTVTIAGKSFTVSQSGAPSCTYSISPQSKAFDASGGSVTVAVRTSTSSCSWAVQNIPSWVSVSRRNGTGNANITITAAANSSTSRSGKITIAGNIFSISQNGVARTSPKSLLLSPAGGSYLVTVYKDGGPWDGMGREWQVSADKPWIRVMASDFDAQFKAVVLGNNTGSPRSGHIIVSGAPPITVKQSGSTVKAVFTKNDTSYALLTNGDLWAWGYGPDVGVNRTENITKPVLVAKGFADIFLGIGFDKDMVKRNHMFGQKTNGEFWAWGANSNGQFGIGKTGYTTSPQKLNIHYAKVAPGVFYSLGLESDGDLWAWGSNPAGCLGDGTEEDRISPVYIGGDFTDVAAGRWHSVGVKKDTSLWTWGINYEGQLGEGADISEVDKRPTPAKIGTGYSKVMTGRDRCFAFKIDGSIWGWGSNYNGEIKAGDTNIKKPVYIGHFYASIAPGWFHTLGLDADGTLWAWGNNYNGQLGDGTGNNSSRPVLVGTGFTSISAGKFHSLALKYDGTVWAWGKDDCGQLGDGNTIKRLSPVRVGKELGWGRQFNVLPALAPLLLN